MVLRCARFARATSSTMRRTLQNKDNFCSLNVKYCKTFEKKLKILSYCHYLKHCGLLWPQGVHIHPRLRKQNVRSPNESYLEMIIGNSFFCPSLFPSFKMVRSLISSSASSTSFLSAFSRKCAVCVWKSRS